MILIVVRSSGWTRRNERENIRLYLGCATGSPPQEADRSPPAIENLGNAIPIELADFRRLEEVHAARLAIPERRDDQVQALGTLIRQRPFRKIRMRFQVVRRTRIPAD